MPTCRNCGSVHDAEELTRHVAEGWLVVHCPDCHAPMGSYRVGIPDVDQRRRAG